MRTSGKLLTAKPAKRSRLADHSTTPVIAFMGKWYWANDQVWTYFAADVVLKAG